MHPKDNPLYCTIQKDIPPMAVTGQVPLSHTTHHMHYSSLANPSGAPKTSSALRQPRRIQRILLCLVSLILTLWVLDAIFPPNMSRYLQCSVQVVDAQGRPVHTFLSPDGMWRLQTMPEDVDKQYLALLLSYEDKRFGMHPGVDPLAILRASAQALFSGHIVSGASTLSMQAARLLEPRPRTLAAKFLEMLRALQLHWHYGAQGVLSIYLTLAPFGSNIEGVRAASYTYFGKEPSRLTHGEAALLVALPQSPTRLRPDRHLFAARQARDKVLARMHTFGMINPKEYYEARTEGIPAAKHPMPMSAPVLSYVLRQNYPYRQHITSTLHLPLQQAAEALCQRHAQNLEKGAATAAVVVHRPTGALRAYVSGKNADASRNYLDLPQAIRSPGSTLKPFIYGLAFSQHILHPETHINDGARRFGDFRPRNFRRRYQGVITVRKALQDSLNVPAVSVLYRLGADSLVNTLRNAGANIVVAGNATLPVALGGAGITLLDLTMLYTSLPNEGIVLPIHIIPQEPAAASAPTNTSLSPVPQGAPAPPSGYRLMSKEAAWQLLDILRATPRPTGYLAAEAHGRPVALKTGTSYGYRDAWAVGASTDWVVGIWVGRPDGQPRPGATGSSAAVPLLLELFDRLPPDAAPWPPPPKGVLLAINNNELPTGLRHFVPLSSPGLPALASEPPRILHPRDGSVVQSLGNKPGEGIALKAAGGTAPLRWLANGVPLPEGTTYWLPDSPGFTQFTLLDAAGRSDVVRIRVALP